MTTSPFAGVEMKQADRARSVLPGGGTLAAMIRDGATIPELRAHYGVGQQAVYVRLRDAGYTSTGANAATPRPKPLERPRESMPIGDDQPPACHGQDPDLFTSTRLADHRYARETFCAHCPIAMFTACQRLAADQDNHDGTWAGVLYVDGRVSPNGTSKPGRPRKETAA